MRCIFLADAHLVDPSRENYQRLLAFLDDQQGRTDILFLLGDIFEFWIGYRHTVFAPYIPILESLRRLRKSGTEIVYVEGNHDFHLGAYIRESLGCRVLPDGGEAIVSERRIYVAHGDLVNPSDWGYRILRRLLRGAPMRLLMKVVPADWSWEIAEWASRQSRKTHKEKRERWLPRNLVAAHARERFAQGYDAVVTGHFHAPFMEEEAGKTIIALGDWIDQYSYAVLESGRFELKTY